MKAPGEKIHNAVFVIARIVKEDLFLPFRPSLAAGSASRKHVSEPEACHRDSINYTFL